MPFDKHKAIELRDLPEEYFDWLLRLDNLRDPLRSAVHAENQRRIAVELAKQEITIRIAPTDAVYVREIVDRGFRATLANHPDRGGDSEKMTRLNLVAETLRAQLAALEA